MFTAMLSEAVRGEEMRELIRAHPLGTWTMLGSIAGRCIQVRVQEVRAGQVASVEVLARAADLADVNDLNLGVPWPARRFEVSTLTRVT